MPPPTNTPPKAPKRHGQVAGRCAQQGAKHVHGLHRQAHHCRPSAACVISGAWRMRGGNAMQLGQGAVDQATDRAPTSRRSKETCEYSRQAWRRIAISRSSRGLKLVWPPSVPKRDPAVAGRDQARHPQPRTRAQQADDVLRRRIGRRQSAGARHCAVGAGLAPSAVKSFTTTRVSKTQTLPHLFDAELPVVVRHPDLVAFHRVGDGHASMGDALFQAGGRSAPGSPSK